MNKTLLGFRCFCREFEPRLKDCGFNVSDVYEGNKAQIAPQRQDSVLEHGSLNV